MFGIKCVFFFYFSITIDIQCYFIFISGISMFSNMLVEGSGWMGGCSSKSFAIV